MLDFFVENMYTTYIKVALGRNVSLGKDSFVLNPFFV